MIIGCALALVIGASLVSPMLLLNTVLNPFPENPKVIANPQSAIMQIGVNLKNIRVELGTYNWTFANSTEPTTLPCFNGVVAFKATKYLNNNQDIPDAENDRFLLQMYVDNESSPIWNSTLGAGAAYTRAYFDDHKGRDISSSGGYLWDKLYDIPQDIHLSRERTGWGTGVGFWWDWPIGVTTVHQGGWSGDIKPNIVAKIDNAQTLTVTLSKIGVITIRGNNTALTLDQGLIETVNLIRQGNAFFYNQDGSNVPLSLSPPARLPTM